MTTTTAKPARPAEMRVAVTAAGAGPGTAIVKAIARGAAGMSEVPRFVVALDMSPDSAGLYLGDAGELVPAAKDPAYVDRVLEACRKHRVNMVIPIFDLETPVFARARERFAAERIHLALNPLACVEDANDKVRSFEVCARAGLRQPERFRTPGEAPADAFPLLGKPHKGIGSKDMVLLSTKDDAIPPGTPVEALLWQRFIRGPEYSIDTFGHPDHGPFVAVPRHRELVRAGQMVKGATAGDADLQDFAASAIRAFDVRDVSCLQVIREEKTGALYFVELNPRYGTGISLSIAAGVPFPLLQWLAHFDPGAITPAMLRWKAGLKMIRYWEELYR